MAGDGLRADTKNIFAKFLAGPEIEHPQSSLLLYRTQYVQCPPRYRSSPLIVGR
jgi:hypothetical protein